MSFARLRYFMGRHSSMLTAATQSSILMSAGDIISQTAVEKKSMSSMDFKRTARFGVMGFFVVGPVVRWWYGVLEKSVVLKYKSPALTATFKMIVDQFFFAPIFIFGFMGILGLLSGQSAEEIIETDIKPKYVDIMINHVKVWPAAQILNFWVVPMQHRVLFGQTVALLWNTYLSFKTNALQPMNS